MPPPRHSNGIRKVARGLVTAGAMVLLASLVHTVVHFGGDLSSEVLVVVMGVVTACSSWIGQSFTFYFGKQRGDDASE